MSTFLDRHITWLFMTYLFMFVGGFLAMVLASRAGGTELGGHETYGPLLVLLLWAGGVSLIIGGIGLIVCAYRVTVGASDGK